MTVDIKQDIRLSQQLIMTPQLQQAIKLLQLSRLELLDLIKQEIQDNPTLEEAISGATETSTEKEVSEYEKILQGGKVEDSKQKDDWEQYVSTATYSSRLPVQPPPTEWPSIDNLAMKRASLSDYLHWQLRLSDFTDIEEEIATQIIGNLDEDGYLMSPLEEIANLVGVDIQTVENVLKRVQEFDPIGVASRDLRECLRAQIRQLNVQGSIVEKIVDQYLEFVESKHYNEIAKALGVTLEDVCNAVKVIANMDPKPGRTFNYEDTIYITPDIFIFKIGDEYSIVLNEDGMPRLKISSIYKDILKRGSKFSQDTREYIENKLKSAVWLIKSIHQRQNTIYKVVKSIIKFQREFLDKGLEYLKPLVLKDVADDIGVHESTISRVTANKYVHTPRGMFELRFFFNCSIEQPNGDAITTFTIKNSIKKIISEEDHAKPFSDSQLTDILKNYHISLSRRTVSKYREILGILPSIKRKRVF